MCVGLVHDLCMIFKKSYINKSLEQSWFTNNGVGYVYFFLLIVNKIKIKKYI